MSDTHKTAAYIDRLERIAAVALQGLLAQSTYWPYSKAAEEAVKYADALIASVDEHTAAYGKMR